MVTYLILWTYKRTSQECTYMRCVAVCNNSVLHIIANLFMQLTTVTISQYNVAK